MFKIIFTISCLWLFLSPKAYSQIELRQGLVIQESTIIQSGSYLLSSNDLETPVIVIEGNDITIDFNNALLDGKLSGQVPNEFTGLGILVRNGKNIVIKNLQARGFKIALLAENVEDLQILDSDFSYNYRMKLYSTRERENFQDWLSYHNNESDEWFRYGAGIYLKNCDQALVKNVRITQGQNALLMTNCNDGLFYNNTFHFNSGLGIGMYRSSRNRIMHNVLNFNIRGHSEGFYNRGQDSAGILVYEQSNDNIFAYNSATHSGDGFFLWAGNHTMETGKGGCNGNLLYGNNFSYAPTNGIEVTFSSNKMINNKLIGCRYGIWGGYSFDSYMAGNEIVGNEYGIAVEHGQNNSMAYNLIQNNNIGIQLWERATQPADWGYAQNRDVQSRDYDIRRNLFLNDSIPLMIASTDRVAINDDNLFLDFKKLLVAEKPNERFYLVKNDIEATGNLGDAPGDTKSMNRMIDPTKNKLSASGWQMPSLEAFAPAAMSDAMSIPPNPYLSRAYMRINEWGPYNYAYPEIWLESIEANIYTFALIGPQGDWRVKKVQGLKLQPSSDVLKIIGKRLPNADFIELEMEYNGAAFVTQLGESIAAGTNYQVHFSRFEKELDWQVQFYAYDEANDPIKNYKAFKNLQTQTPLHQEKSKGLQYVWWRAPHESVPADRFATFARTEANLPRGKYRIILTSDDGVKFYLDGKLLVNRWDVHESAVDDFVVTLRGKHTFEIEHFDANGLANLDMRIEPVE